MPLSKLILFTGLGVGPELLSRQRGFPFQLIKPPWLPPLDMLEPLDRYGRRMLDQMPAVIHAPGPLWLGGVSFGGMVALEAARLLVEQGRQVSGVLLIAAALSGNAVAPPWQLAAEFAAATLTPTVAKPFFAVSPLLYPLVGVSRRQDRAALDQVLPQADPLLWLWGARAAVRWRFPAVNRLPIPIHALHGGSDLIVPADRAAASFRMRRRPVPVIVPRAGHLVNLTHPAQVNAFLLKHVAATEAAPTAAPPHASEQSWFNGDSAHA